MHIVAKLVLPLALTGFLIGGAGCAEEEQKAKDRGTEINKTFDNLKDKAESTTNLATEKLSKMSKDLEEAVDDATEE